MAGISPEDHPVSVYARAVVAGDEIAGDLVRMACERHLDDLDHAADRGFFFDPEAASIPTRVGRLMTHNKGPKAGLPIELEPWQKFRMGSVYGWRETETGLRRFREAYHQVGKKNGKTTDTAIPAIVSQLFDGEASPETYCAATTRDQAGILFNGIRSMVKKSPLLSQALDVQRRVIECAGNDGFIKALSRDSDGADGINPSFVACDEVHRWTDRELLETVRESTIARAQPITWHITTAGHDMGGLCGEMRKYAEDVLRGSVKDDRFFAYVAEPPRDCDPLDPVAWKMGNPNLGISKPVESIAAAARKALAIRSQMPNFRRFHLDLWTDTADAWIDRDSWDAGLMAAPFDPKILYGKPAFVALDLSKMTDTTALAVAVPHEGRIYLIVYVFLPEGPQGFLKRAQAEKKEFIGWRDDGWLEVVKGGAVPVAQLVKRMLWIRSKFDVQQVAFDPWQSKDLVEALDELRFPLLKVPQRFSTMSPLVKATELQVIEGRLRHGGNPVLAWQVGNVVMREDNAENYLPDKRKAGGRIDAAVASIMAVGLAASPPVKKKEREIVVI